MRFVLGADAPDYDNQLATLINLFVMARVLRQETLLGVGDAGHLQGAAVVSRPDGVSPPELGRFRERVWEELGDAARERYEAFGAAWAPFQVDAPHIHLNMIGVRRTAQGTGVGRILIDHVHLMSRVDPQSEGVTLTTEDAANLPLYEHLGYELVGQATVAPGLTTWAFYRPD